MRLETYLGQKCKDGTAQMKENCIKPLSSTRTNLLMYGQFIFVAHKQKYANNNNNGLPYRPRGAFISSFRL